MTPDDFRDHADAVLSGKSWIIALDVLAGATPLVDRLLALDCRVFVIAGSTGTGPVPDPERSEHHLLGTSGATVMAGIRAFQAAVAKPPTALCAALDAWDPNGEARVLANFLNSPDPICGRPVFGGRPEGWLALEDKLVADRLWRESGIPHPRSRIVDAGDGAAIIEAAREVGSAEGAVIAGDNREGWHGGAEYTRYLAPGADPETIIEFFAAHCDEVRVTPFLSGVPCSIHGMVIGDDVVAFRPVEMLVFRRPDSDRFFYSALGSTWDPPANRRQEMRLTVKRVGALLGATVGYRGAFGIDGVMTHDGFLPTELNSRFSGGLALQAKAADEFPLEDLNRFLIEGVSVDIQSGELESLVVTAADSRRTARCLTPIDHFAVDTTVELNIEWTGSAWQVTSDGPSDAVLRMGPSAQGALIMSMLSDDHRIASGPTFAPLAARVFALTDDLWDTRIGPLITGFDTST